MGRTIHSLRKAAGMEHDQWKLFRQSLEREDRENFDEMFSLSKLYNYACLMQNDPILIRPVMMPILFHHYKQLLAVKEEITDDDVTIKPFPQESNIEELDEFIRNAINDGLKEESVKVHTFLDYM
jgi:hypothetical protein